MVRDHRVLLMVFGLILAEGCLKKQHWEVAPPIWPRYVVEGVVLDSVSHQPIWEAEVILVPIRMLFPDSMQPETTYTDAQGYFQFPSIPAAWLAVFVYHDAYKPIEGKNLVVQRDRYIELYMAPRIAKGSRSSPRPGGSPPQHQWKDVNRRP